MENRCQQSDPGLLSQQLPLIAGRSRPPPGCPLIAWLQHPYAPLPGPPHSAAATSRCLLDLEYVQGSALGPCLLSLTACCLRDPAWGLKTVEMTMPSTLHLQPPLISNSPSNRLHDGSSWASKPPLRKSNMTAADCLLVGWRWPCPSVAQAKSLTFIHGAPPFSHTPHPICQEIILAVPPNASRT